MLRAFAGQVGALNDRVFCTRRGAVLLECVLALALFVAAGMAVLAMVDHAVDSVATTRDVEQAADIARTAMARIESGLSTPDTLNGPVKWGQESGSEEEAPPHGAWALEVETEPSQFNGLTRVSVRAFKQASPGSEKELASYTLYQLVRLTEKADGGPPKPAGPSGPAGGGA